MVKASASFVKPRVLLLTAVFVFSDCKVINHDVSHSEESTSTATGHVETEIDKITTQPGGVQDFPGDSSLPRPETEEDLVSEMEDLFKAMQLLGYDLDFDRNRNSTAGDEANTTDTAMTPGSARGKMSDMMFHPAMLVPQLIMWGFAPVILANLKMFVMQALMMNKMALNAAIFMTLRNIVFGPRPGPVVKYANHGYGHHHQSKIHHPHRRRS